LAKFARTSLENSVGFIGKKLADANLVASQGLERALSASWAAIDRTTAISSSAALAASVKEAIAPIDPSIYQNAITGMKEALTPVLPSFCQHAPLPSVVKLRRNRFASISEEFWLRIDPDVTAVSRNLFEDGHFAQAVFEAVKRFDNEVRERSISCGKGAFFGVALMKEVFSPERPVISVAECSTTTGQNIQKGMMYLSMGLISRIRNPLGHENVTMPLEEAKVWIGLISQLMKDLKRAPPVVGICS
jgi:uncharacterized protein (TIGR02391 family)